MLMGDARTELTMEGQRGAFGLVEEIFGHDDVAAQAVASEVDRDGR